MRHLAGVVALTLAAGCGGQGHAAAPGESRTTAPPTSGGYFNDPRNIVAKSAGAIPCADLEETRNPSGQGVLEQVTCAKGEIVIRVHENHAGVDAQINMLRLVGGDLLTGDNWTVNADPATLQDARQHLGGTIVHIDCQPPDCALDDGGQ